MEKRFEVVFLEHAIDFMSKVDKKAKAKIYYNLDKAKLGLDQKLFKKLTDDIWESGLNTQDFNTDFSHSGTELEKPKRL